MKTATVQEATWRWVKKQKNWKGKNFKSWVNCPFKGLHHAENGSGKTQCGYSTLIQSFFSSEGRPPPPQNNTGIIVGAVVAGVVGLLVLLVAPILLIVYLKKRGKGFYHCRCSLLLQNCLPRWTAGRGRNVTPLFIRWIAEQDRGHRGDGGEGGDGGGRTSDAQEM